MSEQAVEETPELVTKPEISIHYSRVILPAVISGWVIALLIGPLSVARSWSESFQLGPALTLLFLATLQGVFGTRWLLAPEQRLLSHTRFRLAEMVIITVIIRLVVWGVVAPPTAETFRGYLISPLSILDGNFIFHLLISLAGWGIARSIATIFYGMAVLPEEEAFLTDRRTLAEGRATDAYSVINLRSTQLNSFLSYWLNGALFLVICTTITTHQFEELGANMFRSVTRLGIPSELLVGLILFIVLGLWLLSWGRLQVMQLRWLTERAAIHRPVPTQWQRLSLLLIGAVALMAGFLPIGSTFALARIIQAIILIVIRIVGFIANLLFMFLEFIFSFFSNNSDEPMPEAPEPFEIELAPLSGEGAPEVLSETAQMVRGGIFWSVAIVAIILLLIFFLRERGYRFDSRILRAIWRDLKGLWQAFFGRVELATKAIRQRLALAQRPDLPEQPPWRYVNLRNLPPRERIRYFYLSILRRAEARGVIRRQEETPLEFVEDLKEEWPDAREEIDDLTTAFLAARYSTNQFSENDIGPIKRTWQQVRSGIKRRRDRKKQD